MSKSILLILGAGQNIGLGVAQAFKAAGYKIAVASRSTPANISEATDLSIKADFTVPESIESVFSKVKQELGEPSVVVYNAASFVKTPDLLTTLSPKEFENTLAINTVSPYAAAQQAVKSFEASPGEGKTFIYTGNGLNTKVVPSFLTLGVGKTATAFLIGAASEFYKEKGFRFYYADERKENGDYAYGDIDGPAHGEFYLDLVREREQGPYIATFVKGKGYVDFGGK